MTQTVSVHAGQRQQSKRMAWWALYAACGILAVVCLLAEASRKQDEQVGNLPAVSAPGLLSPAQTANPSASPVVNPTERGTAR